MLDKILYYLLPILKVFLFLVFLITCLMPFWLITNFDFIKFDEESLSFLLFSEIGLCTAIFSALLMTFKVLGNYSFEQIFVSRFQNSQGFGYGFLIGFCLILCCSGLAWINGNVIFTLAKFNAAIFFYYLLLYIVVAICEEVLFRSFVLVVFAERYTIYFAIFLTSCLFGLAHIGNPSFNWMAMLNITLAGTLFSILILQQRNISWAIGIHFGWNFTQGNLLGYAVSGVESPGILAAKPIGPYYLSGGVFGIESSLFCTAVLMIVITYLLVKYDIKNVSNQ